MNLRRLVLAGTALLTLTLAGCLKRVDVEYPDQRGDLVTRRVKVIVRDPGDGKRHALVVDVDGMTADAMVGTIRHDAIETGNGMWAEVKPAHGMYEIPYRDILHVSHGPTGEEVATAVLAGICAGMCDAAASGALKGL